MPASGVLDFQSSGSFGRPGDRIRVDSAPRFVFGFHIVAVSLGGLRFVPMSPSL